MYSTQEYPLHPYFTYWFSFIVCSQKHLQKVFWLKRNDEWNVGRKSSWKDLIYFQLEAPQDIGKHIQWSACHIFTVESEQREITLAHIKVFIWYYRYDILFMGWYWNVLLLEWSKVIWLYHHCQWSKNVFSVSDRQTPMQ